MFKVEMCSSEECSKSKGLPPHANVLVGGLPVTTFNSKKEGAFITKNAARKFALTMEEVLELETAIENLKLPQEPPPQPEEGLRLVAADMLRDSPTLQKRWIEDRSEEGRISEGDAARIRDYLAEAKRTQEKVRQALTQLVTVEGKKREDIALIVLMEAEKL